jgi:NAD(P)-dependent dehydrogenase (short-subunit alcohol dehydrogenase family)
MTNPIESTSNVSPPPYWWRAHQALKGTNPARLTEGDVPRVELSGKWIIVTGANNGIGYEASKVFAEWGANLILACREPPPREQHPTAVTEECQSLAKSAGYSSEIEWWKVDFADLSSVESFAKRWLDTGRALDVLCNNAGTGAHPTAKRVYTVDGYEFIHQVFPMFP